MSDDIEIEEHDIFESPIIKAIFSDVSEIKEELNQYLEDDVTIKEDPDSSTVDENQLVHHDTRIKAEKDINIDRNINTPLNIATGFLKTRVMDSKPNINTGISKHAGNVKEKFASEDLEREHTLENNLQSSNVIIDSKSGSRLTDSDKNIETKSETLVRKPNVNLQDIGAHLKQSKRYCIKCKTLFPNRHNYNKHMKDFHVIKSATNHSKTMNTRQNGLKIVRIQLLEEKKVHYKHKCSMCDLRFGTLFRLSQHHTNIHQAKASLTKARNMCSICQSSKRPVSFSPSALNIPTVDTVPEGMTCVDAEVEYIGFTPSTSTHTTQYQLPNSPLPLDEDDEVQRVTNPGSDMDSDDDTTVDRIRITDTPMAPRRGNDDVHVEALLDVLDSQDDLALREIADEDMCTFEWFSDPEVFTGRREEFTGEAGPTFNVSGMSPFDILQQIWDDDIIGLIVRETNRYGQEHKALWVNINAEEIWVFFALLMLQTIVICPVEKDYWYPCLPKLKVGNFNGIMPYKRFSEIKRSLHFVDNHSMPPNVSRDSMKLAKIMPIIDHLNAKFGSLYLPEQNIAIDESLLGWKGRLSFVHMIKNKAAQVGIKSYALCESRTGYLWKIIVYAGKGNQETVPESGNSGEPEGATSKIVYDLVRPLLNKGHTLVMDNFYNSPLLSRTLKAKKTDTMGTLRLNRQFVPASLQRKSKSNTRVGEVAASYTKDLSICVWHDANMVSMISTFHKVEVGEKEKYGKYKFKPQVVLDYNLSMGGVDKKDRMLQAFPIERTRNQIWYKKLFHRLLNVSIYNSFVLYKTNHPSTTQRQFRMTLADQILDAMRPPLTIPLHVTNAGGHFPVRNESRRSRCRWCSIKHKKQSRTVFKCQGCNVNLCIGISQSSCFTEYHLYLQREQ